MNKKNLFETKDKSGRTIILEYIKTNTISAEYTNTLKTCFSIAKPAYMQVEMDFLKTHPEVVGHDIFFKPFEPLFNSGIKNVNWADVENKMLEILTAIFMSDYSNADIKLDEKTKKSLSETIQIIILAKDKISNKPLGFINFMVAPNFAKNTIKCTIFAIKPEYQNLGIGKILMSSIFKILPTINRIFLCTRITNKQALNAYLQWGFVKDENPDNNENGYTFNLNHWIFLEYKAKSSNLLQKFCE